MKTLLYKKIDFPSKSVIDICNCMLFKVVKQQIVVFQFPQSVYTVSPKL